MQSKRLASIPEVLQEQKAEKANEMLVPLGNGSMVIKGIEHVPAEKVEAMAKYAKELVRKFPQLKKNQARLTRKVAEYFKIKLI